MVEECLEAYFYLTVNGEECYLFQDKNGNLHKPHHKENEMYVFLQESPKADRITYVNKLYHFCTKIIRYIMETKELKITIPEGQEIDWQESAKQDKIVFKKKDAKPVFKRRDTKPKSWEDYLELNTGFDGVGIDWNCGGVQTTGLHHRGKAIVPTHLAQPFIAMMQLMSLRQEWIRDWQPDWSKGNYCVAATNSNISAGVLLNFTHPLSFPTQEMAADFMNCFRDLLEIAKPLI